MRMTGAEAIVEILKLEGIEYVFGLCGHGDVSVLDALYGSGIKFVSVRNEGTAVHMADAYYRTSHKLAAVLTTIGPGLTNTATAVADAMTDGAAIVLISGDAPNYFIGKGALQEISVTGSGNQFEILRPITKWASRVPELSLIPHYLYQALNMSQTGNPGPVLVSVPMNFFSEVGEFEIDDPRRRRPLFVRSQGDERGVGQALELLTKASRPLILAGNGVVISEATPELIELATALQVPVATSTVGQGAMPKSHPLNIDCPNSVANPAVAHAIKNADLVLAIGTRFSEIETSSWRTEFSFNPWSGKQKIVQIDLVASEIGRNYPVEVGIIGDAKAVLAQLIAKLKARGVRPSGRSPWLEDILRLKADWEVTKSIEISGADVPIKTQRLFGELSKAMPAGSIVLIDTGGFGYAAGQHLPFEEPLTFYYNLGIGSMGPCMAGALGAKLANPDRKVISLVGDGGVTCEMSPLVTAVEYRIPVLWVVLNNYSYNSIEAYQHKHYGHRMLGTQFRDPDGKPYNPDFVALARACGADGARVEEPGDLPKALKTALSAPGPYLLDVVTGETRFPKTYGFFEANTFFAAEAEFKRQRTESPVGVGSPSPSTSSHHSRSDK